MSQRDLCPICNGLGNVLYRQNFGAESTSFLSSYDVSVCRDCGCGFAAGIPPQAEFDAYYRDMSKYEYQHQGGGATDYETAIFNAPVRHIEQFAPDKDTRILDIGCATGRFLWALKGAGYTDLTGSDPSAQCAATAQRLYGLRVITAPLAGLTTNEGLYELVLMTGVLEHLCDLHTALEQVTRLLAPNGRLYIIVPDVAQLEQFKNAPFQLFSVEHINFFSVQSLDNLMRRHGLRRVFVAAALSEQSHNTVEPDIAVAYERDDTMTGAEIVRDTITESALRDYCARSQQAEDAVARDIEALVETRQPLLVWGVGTNTLHLLHTTRLGEANIVAFVDSNPKYQDKTLHDRPIIAPEMVGNYSEDILIGSWMFQSEIETTIRETLGLANGLIKLYRF